MEPTPRPAPPHQPTLAFVEELLRTGFMLIDTMSSLLDDMPDGAFGDEDNGNVLIEMVAGSVRPATIAAGVTTVRHATRLLVATRERVLADLQLAARIARRREEQGLTS